MHITNPLQGQRHVTKRRTWIIMSTSVWRMRLSTCSTRGDHAPGRSSARDSSPCTHSALSPTCRLAQRRRCALAPRTPVFQPGALSSPPAPCRRQGRTGPAPTWLSERGPDRRLLPAGPHRRQNPRPPPALPQPVPAPPPPLSASPRHHVWRGRTGPGPAAPPRSARRSSGHSLARAAAASAPPLPPAASAFCPSRGASPGNRRRGGAGRGAVSGRAPSPADGAARGARSGAGGEPGLLAGAGAAARGTERAWRERGQGGPAGAGPGQPDSPCLLPKQE